MRAPNEGDPELLLSEISTAEWLATLTFYNPEGPPRHFRRHNVVGASIYWKVICLLAV